MSRSKGEKNYRGGKVEDIGRRMNKIYKLSVQRVVTHYPGEEWDVR